MSKLCTLYTDRVQITISFQGSSSLTTVAGTNADDVGLVFKARNPLSIAALSNVRLSVAAPSGRTYTRTFSDIAPSQVVDLDVALEGVCSTAAVAEDLEASGDDDLIIALLADSHTVLYEGVVPLQGYC